MLEVHNLVQEELQKEYEEKFKAYESALARPVSGDWDWG
jgi:hypothetical protein